MSLKLSGGVYVLSVAEGGGAIFLMQPLVSSLQEMVRHKLYFSTDIPVHSPQRDLIMTNERLKSKQYMNKQARLESSLEMKRMFVRYVSHEIR